MDHEENERKFAAMEKWSDCVRSELADLITKNLSDTIFHYADVKGLLGMIENCCIWATHVSKLNDKSEHNHGVKLVKEFVSANTPKSSRPLIEKALEDFEHVDTYVACYSTKRDLLSQWRCYAKSRVGYSIGFQTSKMATLDGESPILEKFIYKESVAKSVLNYLLHKVDEFLNQNDFGDIEVRYLIGMVQAILNIISCIIKYPKFKGESEYRQIYQPNKTGLYLEEQFREGQFGLTPYVKIPLLENGKLSLRSITVGPCPDIDIEVKSLNSLLSKYKYHDVEIIKTDIPLRI